MARFELAPDGSPCDRDFEIIDSVIRYLFSVDDHSVVTSNDGPDEDVGCANVLIPITAMRWLEVTSGHHESGWGQVVRSPENQKGL